MAQEPEKNVPEEKSAFLTIKWIFIASVVILLVACLTLKVAWKFNLLLAILITVPTIIPAKIRKYCYTGYILILIGTITWIMLPWNSEGWETTNITDTIKAFNTRYALPGELNAAPIYTDLITNCDGNKTIHKDDPKYEEYKDKVDGTNISDNGFFITVKGTFYPDFWDSDSDEMTMGQFWKSSDHPELASWVSNKIESISEQLNLLNTKPKCFFHSDSEISALMPQNFHSAEKILAMLMVRAGNNAFADGDIDMALQYYKTNYTMAKHLYQQPNTLSQLVAVSIQAMTNNRLNAVLMSPDFNDRYIDNILEILHSADINIDNQVKLMVDGSALEAKYICASLYEINEQGSTRLARKKNPILNTIMPLYFNNSQTETSYWSKRALKTGILIEWFLLPSSPQKMQNAADEYYKSLISKANTDWLTEPAKKSWADSHPINYKSIIQLLGYDEASLKHVYLYHTKAQSSTNSTMIIARLKQYKNHNTNWPASLDELDIDKNLLIDPVNNGEYVYQLNGDSFVLYSRGANNIDEGGIINSRQNKDDLLYWPLELTTTE